jgi:flagellar motor switch protein FliG
LLPPQAAEVLAALAPEEQLAVICRIATIGEPSPDAIRDVEMGLKQRLSGTGGHQPAGHRGVASAIKILNSMAPAVERNLLGKLAEVEPQLVREIRRAMFGADVAVCDQYDVSGAAC